MKLTIKRKINNAVVDFELDERDEKVAIGKAITLAVEDYCGNCKSNSIVWRQNKATDDKGGTFVYIKRRCLKCGAESTLGEYQGGLGYFWREFAIYEGKGGQGTSNYPQGSKAPQNAKSSPTDDSTPLPVPNQDIKVEKIPF